MLRAEWVYQAVIKARSVVMFIEPKIRTDIESGTEEAEFDETSS